MTKFTCIKEEETQTGKSYSCPFPGRHTEQCSKCCYLICVVGCGFATNLKNLIREKVIKVVALSFGTPGL